MLVPLGCDTHTIAHLTADREGLHKFGSLRVQGCLTGDGYGIAHFAPLGKPLGVAQFFDGKGRTGKYGVVVLIHQILKAVFCLFVQLLQIHAAAGSLACQSIGHIPVVYRRILHLFLDIFHFAQTDVLGNGAGKFIHAKNAGMQQQNQRCRRHNPAKPLDRIPLENDHQHDTCHRKHHQSQQNCLPHAELHADAPVCHKVLDHSGHVGIHHIHQLAVCFSKFPEGPGAGCQNGRNQITSPIFQRIHLLIKCFSFYSS